MELHRFFGGIAKHLWGVVDVVTHAANWATNRILVGLDVVSNQPIPQEADKQERTSTSPVVTSFRVPHADVHTNMTSDAQAHDRVAIQI